MLQQDNEPFSALVAAGVQTELTVLIELIKLEMALPHIPVSVDLWDARYVGAYLKCTARQVTERYAVMPDFPIAIRLPSSKGRGHPKWRANEVVAWVEKYRETA